MARLMDRYLGVPSLGWDKDQIRRKTYGKAGNCRVKEYGVEYRALSNAWLFEPTIMRYVFDATIKAAKALKNGEDGDIIGGVLSMTANLFQIGDRVTMNEYGMRYLWSNSIKSTPYTEGEIIEKNVHSTKLLWDNGYKNTYRDEHLQLTEEKTHSNHL
jgi:hypothetical protein